MATTTVAHASLIRYDSDGNQLVINLKNTGDDVSINRSTNGNLPSGATTAQGLANSLGALAFKNSLSKSDIGLGNVNNTADSSKSVKYATSAGSANAVAWSGVTGKPSTFTPSSHTHNYAGSSSAGGPATSASSLVHGAIQCGDNKNTTGYRLIATVNLNQWSNFRAVLLVRSRHEGAGILSIGIGCNSATVSYDNAYAEIKYFGIVGSGSVISTSAYQIHISSDGKTAYLFELYQDYSSLYYVTLSSDFEINANGTWVTSISTATYGKLKATTEINRASSVDWSGVQNKPSTYPSEDNLVVSKTTPNKACLWAKID